MLLDVKKCFFPTSYNHQMPRQIPCVLTYLAIKTNKENSDSTVQYSMCAMWPADCSV